MFTECAIPDYTFAYQPIVDTDTSAVFAYEALVRGREGQSAGSIFNQISEEQLHRFDREARIRALMLAGRLGLKTRLSLNFMPRSLQSFPDAVKATLAAAHDAGIAPGNLILEITEGEAVQDAAGFAERMNAYRAQGVGLAIDDFGAGFSGLNLLSEFQPDVVKLDMQLVREIDRKGPRQAIVRAVIQVCDDLGIDVIAEGVESEAECRWFMRVGVHLFQGYYFGHPVFEALPAAALLQSMDAKSPAA